MMVDTVTDEEPQHRCTRTAPERPIAQTWGYEAANTIPVMVVGSLYLHSWTCGPCGATASQPVAQPLDPAAFMV